MRPLHVPRPVLAAALVVAFATPASAQLALPEPPGVEGRVLELGIRAGLDYDQEAFVLGSFLRMPVDPWRRLALMPGIEMEVLPGTVDWQLNADAVLLFGRGGSLFVGGGAAFRNAIYQNSEGRDTRLGYSLVLGLRSPPGRSDFGSQIELRWIEVDTYSPRVISVGLTWGVPLRL